MSEAAKGILEKVGGTPLISKRPEFSGKAVVATLTDIGERDLLFWLFK